MTPRPALADCNLLGIEGGGTRTVALLADGCGRLLRRLEQGPANLRFLSDAALTRILRSIASALPRPDAVGIGLAGGWTKADWERIQAAATKVWPSVPHLAGNDLETALLAASPPSGAAPQPRVLIVSGTGSGVYGGHPDGRRAKVGGWGHLLGDRGSGYDIAVTALRALAAEHDRDDSWPGLGARLLRALQLNEPNDLIPWAQAASKADIASLAPEVFAAAQNGDRLARLVLAGAAAHLTGDAFACARKLATLGTRVSFVLAGGILLGQPAFAARVARELRKLWPGATVGSLTRESAWGAVELAKRALAETAGTISTSFQAVRRITDAAERAPAGNPESASRQSRGAARVEALPSPTEARNSRSRNLDTMPVASAIRLMLSEEAAVPAKLLAETRRIEQVIRTIVRAFRRGGRLFYVGAGTSGRLGVLDASECPPTFRAPAEQVQGIIAGGRDALWKSVEGAEDEAGAGCAALRFRRVNSRDVVIGIAASGTTPFVWGALKEAKRRHARTVLVCFNPLAQAAAPFAPDVIIAPSVGPEVLTGSTRLKAGTATKLLLNLFTTLAMVRLGKVRSNLMIDLHPANLKLRARAVRILQELTRVDHATAQTALEKSGWVIQRALACLEARGRKA